MVSVRPGPKGGVFVTLETTMTVIEYEIDRVSAHVVLAVDGYLRDKD